MYFQLDKINLEFRKITDRLFFTDLQDIDTRDYKNLLYQNKEHLLYLEDRLSRAMDSFWEESFWIDRFNLLFDLLDQKKLNELENNILRLFDQLIINYVQINPIINNEYKQIIAWCKVKLSRKENTIPIRNYLLLLPNNVHGDKIKNIINNFIPYLFSDMSEYMELLSKRIGQSANNFYVLQHLEKQGFPVNKNQIYKICQDFLFKKVPNRKNRRSLFAMMADDSIRSNLKSEYKANSYRDKLVAFIKVCDYQEIETHHLRNIGYLLDIDSSVADEIIITYADSLYARTTGIRGANVNKLIRLCKTYPDFSPKKILAYLSNNHKMSDIKRLVAAFPDLKTLVPFV